MSETYRVLVTGSRDWVNRGRLMHEMAAQVQEHALFRTVVLVHGGCLRGADRMAADEAAGLGWQVEPHPADWNRYGKSAGFRRNAEMVALGADLCLAFIRNGSRGASHCADLAEKAGIETLRFTSA